MYKQLPLSKEIVERLDKLRVVDFDGIHTRNGHISSFAICETIARSSYPAIEIFDFLITNHLYASDILTIYSVFYEYDLTRMVEDLTKYRCHVFASKHDALEYLSQASVASKPKKSLQQTYDELMEIL